MRICGDINDLQFLVRNLQKRPEQSGLKFQSNQTSKNYNLDLTF